MSYFYVSQTDVEHYLGITLTGNGQSLFNLLQQPMQDLVDRYCNRSWAITNPITQVWDAFRDPEGPLPTKASYRFIVDYPTISSITSVTVAGTAVDLQYVYNYGTYFELFFGPNGIIIPNTLGLQSVVAIYSSASAQAVPGPVKLALVQWMARMIQTAEDSGKDTTRVQTGQVQVQFNPTIPSDMPEFVKMVLKQYRFSPVRHR